MARSSKAQLGLQDLIGPCSISSFFRSYWGKQVLSIERNDPDFYAGLPTLSEFEFLVASLPVSQDGWFALIKGYAERASKSALNQDGTLNLRGVYEAVGQGYSLRLSKLHRRHVVTGQLCRHLEAGFARQGVLINQPLGANAYFTPPSAQGLAPHYDDHDVFILQLAGQKTWRIYDRAIDSPIKRLSRGLTAEEIGKPVHEFAISAGDLVYLPRGVPHEALTTDDLSLHLTISVYPATWRDLFVAILDADPHFQQNLPSRFALAGQPRACDLKSFRALANSLRQSPAVEAAIWEIVRRPLSTSDLFPRSNALRDIASLSDLNEHSRVRLAEGVQVNVEVNGATVTLRLPGASVEGHTDLEPTFRMIASGHALSVGDLAIVTNEADKLKLVSDLLRGGFMQRCD